MKSVPVFPSVPKAVEGLWEQPIALVQADSLRLLQALPDASIDLVVTSPPYCMGKKYETSNSVQDFIEAHKLLLPEVARVVKPQGHICWQVGYHVRRNVVYPLDFAIHNIMETIPDVVLRNRVIWTYAHGLHATKRFSGRHETVMWYSKGGYDIFNLDDVRVPQKYPGKRHYKGPSKGEFSGNPLGKNPGDVWEIPNVKGNHVEKTEHPCQFPVALIQRLVRALTEPDAVVMDPFMGSGSAGVAVALEGRRFVGCEIERTYIKIAQRRIRDALAGVAKVRPLERPIFKPTPGLAVATAPEHFARGE